MTKTAAESKSDITPGNGILARAPRMLQPYILLARLDRPIGIWLLLLPGWWAIVLASGGAAAMNAQDWRIFVLFGTGAVVMRAAGCIVNDLWDRDLDKQVGRTRLRPLAAGTVGVKGAAAFLIMLLIAGFLILLQMNLVTILLGFLSIPLIVLYPLMKRWTWWPQAFLGLTFNFGALMGWSAVTGTLQMQAVLLYAAGFFWTLGYDTVYAHQDREDDLMAGMKSTAIRLDAHSRVWVAGFYSGALVLAGLAFLRAAGNLWAPMLLIPAAAHGIRNFRRWKSRDPESCLKVFRASRDTGLLILLAALVV